ncbi:MAG TPA: hypothetical protein VN873_16305 [Candidatus Angelobacter sp.]|nr:hypothetical protein [Candidatus Angelobacter sp.]
MHDDLYQKARELLRRNPEMGKKKLGDLLGVKTPTSRRLIERYRGETSGHNAGHPVYERVRDLKDKQPDWGAVKIAQALCISLDHAKLHLARWIGAQSFSGATGPSATAGAAPEPSPAGGPELQDTVRDGTRDLAYHGTKVHSLEDLLVYAQVDTRIWEVEKYIVNRWEVGTKVGTEILTAPLYQFKVWLRRKVIEQNAKELMQGLLEQFKMAAPVRPAIPKQNNGAGMLEVSIMDLHFGKYAWREECGRQYDLEICRDLFWTALEDLLEKSASLKPGKFLFVAGNDFFNTDILGRTTTSGTPQDQAATVWRQSFVEGKALLVKAIERMRELAPVDVVFVNGNHDTQSVFFVGETVSAWFRNTPGVTIDNSPTTRKYVHFGQNLIGYSHGNLERHPMLPLLMANERPQAWAQSRHREWHLGHFHVKKHKMFVPADDQQGVLVRIVPSLCPADAWHASMGYGGKLAAEAYYWDPQDGCVATFTHSPV